MRIQITGHQGMLGQAVYKRAQQRGHTAYVPGGRASFDIRRAKPTALHGDVVINCAGLVKQRERHPSNFILTNSYGPHWLAELCDTTGVRLIHVSTDCVFGHPGPHDEDSMPTGHDIYARSKLAGEVEYDPHLTVRTSFVGFGPRGLIHELQTLPRVLASDQLLWSGHTVDTVADVLITLAERSDICGLLHIPGEFQSRLRLVHRLIDWLTLPTEILQNTYSQDRRLISKRWETLNLPNLPSFDEQLEQMEIPCPV